jgi:hypothetical protein
MIIHAENQGTKVEMFLSIQMSSAVHIFITPAKGAHGFGLKISLPYLS